MLAAAPRARPVRVAHPAHKMNSTLLGRARQLHARVRRRLGLGHVSELYYRFLDSALYDRHRDVCGDLAPARSDDHDSLLRRTLRDVEVRHRLKPIDQGIVCDEGEAHDRAPGVGDQEPDGGRKEVRQRAGWRVTGRRQVNLARSCSDGLIQYEVAESDNRSGVPRVKIVGRVGGWHGLWEHSGHRSQSPPPNVMRMSCGRHARRNAGRPLRSCHSPAHKMNSTLLGRARQLHARVRQPRYWESERP